MNRTRVTEECLPQAAPSARAAIAARRARTGARSRTVAGGEAPTVGRCTPHGHG
ncbi:hypothetical protein [Streptomyces vinaceus]|uniref:hypothetical protein n=1 Tax=Streptomyces vinaceus TaxID=1960 RepID=UPI00142EC23E|nr:hypothetical protein [Streptomyces vinaceus]GHE64694.1 hypothetical protein GCM10017778_56980 [Streptomyces vinaceus]